MIDKEWSICTLQKDGEPGGPCKGDSGGPLVCNLFGSNMLIGIVSWGLKCGSKEPDVFASVGSHLQWIHSILERHQ